MSESIYGLSYKQNCQIIINNIPDSTYYCFDYDEHSYQVNIDLRHSHSFHEIHLLLNPEASRLVEGVPYSIGANGFVLLRLSLLHEITCPEGAPDKRLIINFLYPQEYLDSHPALRLLLDPFSEALPVYRFGRDKQLVLNQIVDEIYLSSEQQLPSDVKMMIIHNRFQAFLYKLWELKSYNLYISEEFNNKQSKKICRITAYIHTHYQEELTLKSLARQLYMNTYYLSHRFRNITGYTLIRYIQMTRIRNAQYALINSSGKMTDISEQSGFASFSQLSRVFRRFYGVPPSDFREDPVISVFPPRTSSE